MFRKRNNIEIRKILTLHIAACMVLLSAGHAVAQEADTLRGTQLEAVSISAQGEGISRMGGAINGTLMGQDVLFRAACCNLGESFVNNAAVDVNYNDAAVGARQIKLLGLSGRYVQMLCEGLPMASGAALPYLLGRVPGSWMQSLQVSKGASSVKNGYQSVTGQIDVEYIKPDAEPTLRLNLYGDSRRKLEGNVVGNFRVSKHGSNAVMVHVERDLMHHDENGDGWVDMPMVQQVNVSDRFKLVQGRYIMHAGFSLFDERRHGGTVDSARVHNPDINLRARGVEAYMKHAYLLNADHNTNIALMANAMAQTLGGTLGRSAVGYKRYDEQQQEMHAQLIVEHDFTDAHQLSAGVGMQAEHLNEDGNLLATPNGRATTDVVPGMYAQYTYKPSYRLTAMAGLRLDHSTLHARTFLTPRMHIKWMASDWLTLRASVGKGYRTVHALAEYHYLATTGRTLRVDNDLPMEEAWNTGASAVFYIPLGERTLSLGAEYYYTHFNSQVVVDYDSDPTTLHIGALQGRSFSHTLQLDATLPLLDELEATVALRLNDVRCTYGGTLMEQPLQSRYKGLLTLSWTPMMALWHVDLTLQLNGPGRMPTPYMRADGSPSWDERFAAYPQLNMQVAREWRWGSLYVGGENLTNYRQPMPVVDAANPLSSTFDPTLLWGPVHGVMAYAGIRVNIK